MGKYQTLMERINDEKRRLFELVINKVITTDQFQEKCQEIERDFENKYFLFMAEKHVFLGPDEIWLDMGMQPNYS